MQQMLEQLLALPEFVTEEQNVARESEKLECIAQFSVAVSVHIIISTYEEIVAQKTVQVCV